MGTADILDHLARADASPAQWASLVERHGTRLWAVARAVAGRELADDAFQDCLITIRRKAGRFMPGADPEASAVGWLITVAHNAAVDLVRRESRRRRREGAPMPEDQAGTQPTPPEQQEAARRAMAALDELPERHREVIRLRLLGGMDAEATASVLGCPAEQVRVRLYRALELLRTRCTAQALVPVSMLEEALHRAATPPVSLPASAQHIASHVFTLPVATGVTTGAIMAASSICVGIAAIISSIAYLVAGPAAPAVESATGIAVATSPNAEAPVSALSSPLPLFDGRDLSSWWIDPDLSPAHIDHGELVVHNAIHSGFHAEIGGMSWDDYEVDGEFCLVSDTTAACRAAGSFGWNLQLCPHDTMIFAQLLSGSVTKIAYVDNPHHRPFVNLVNLGVAAPARMGSWHHFSVLASGGVVATRLDGLATAATVSPIGTRGMFGLVVNFASDAEMRLRNLTIAFLKPTTRQLQEYARPAAVNWREWVEAQPAAASRGIDAKTWPVGKLDFAADAPAATAPARTTSSGF